MTELHGERFSEIYNVYDVVDNNGIPIQKGIYYAIVRYGKISISDMNAYMGAVVIGKEKDTRANGKFWSTSQEAAQEAIRMLHRIYEESEKDYRELLSKMKLEGDKE